LIHRNEPNRPHISSDIEFSKSAETKPSGSANPLSATRQQYLNIPSQTSNQGIRPNHPSNPNKHQSAAGERGFREITAGLQPLFPRRVTFFTSLHINY
jgi:hypothetical protein